MDMFMYDLFAEEDFKKNSVTCLFGTLNGTFTLGVAEDGSPKSLMKNDQLDKNKEKPVGLLISKQRKSENTIVETATSDYKTRYNALETAYYNYKKEAEAIEYKIQDMDLRKMKLETTLCAYKHSKIINEFDADIWNGLLDKCIVLKNGYEFV